MKIVLISDTHGLHDAIDVPNGDILIHSGDVSSRGTKSEVVDFLDWFSGLPHTHKIFIAGNHDFLFEKSGFDISDFALPPNVHYLCNSAVKLDPLKIYGSPVTPWFYNWAFNVSRGPEIAAYWSDIPDDTDILVTHGPPYGILDSVSGERVGCKDLATRIQSLPDLKLHVFGHIHDQSGSYKLRRHEEGYDVLCVNASMLNDNYKIAYDARVIDAKTEFYLKG